jgi:hypothetical protein
MIRSTSTFFALSLCAGLAPAVGLAQSVTPQVSTSNVVGQWNVTFFTEPFLTKGATQGICFTAAGTWFSTTFSNWQGDWFLKGDRLRWYGRTSGLATAEFGQFSFNTGFGGEFAHFVATPTSIPPLTSSRGNFAGGKVSATCSAAAPSGITGPGADPSK